MKITEEEIRPEKVFDEYLKLADKDIVTYFSDVKKEDIQCPACGCSGSEWVIKQSFKYDKCDSCQTIYVNPRPVVSAFEDYYTDSPSTKYWANTFYKITESARREKLWRPKAQMIKDRLLKYADGEPINCIVDIGGGYGVFDEEIKKIMNIECIIIEPSVHLAKICRDKGFVVLEKFMENLSLEELPNCRKCFVSFELFEHLHDPKVFLKVVYNSMKKGDIFIFTTLSGMGIDIQLLKGKSKSLSPPHHLNFFNPHSAAKLLSSIGFTVLESITPGKLDIDILKKNENDVNCEYLTNLFQYLTVHELDKLQANIAEMKLSSHMMLTAIKY